MTIDLTGKQYGRLRVEARSPNRGPKNQIRWRCICDCGRQCEPYGYSLRYGHTTSCGCARIGGYTAINGRVPLTQDRLKKVLDYEPSTGIFKWRIKPSRTTDIGRDAGLFHVDGYRIIGVDGKDYRAARLAWLFVHGSFPPAFIDHKDGDPANDRIDNLRLASPKENARNARAKSQRLGHLKGAYYNKKTRRWFSAIRVDRRTSRLGSFDTREQAHAAYVKAAREMHGEFARCR